MIQRTQTWLDLDIIGYVEICTYVMQPYEAPVLRNNINMLGYEEEEILWEGEKCGYKIAVTKYKKVSE